MIELNFCLYALTSIEHGKLCLIPLIICNVVDCRACQCSPLRHIFMECSIMNPAVSLLMKQLVIDQGQKVPNLSAFHWSPYSSLVSVCQHFITMRVVHLPKRTESPNQT